MELLPPPGVLRVFFTIRGGSSPAPPDSDDGDGNGNGNGNSNIVEALTTKLHNISLNPRED